MRPSVSVILVSYNTRDLLLEAIGSLQSEPDVETIVVDNASSDGSAEAVTQVFPRVQLIRAGANLGFAAGVNLGARNATGEALLLLNPDASLRPGALAALRELLDREPRAAAVGAALRYADGSEQESAFRFPGYAQVLLDLFPIHRLAGSRLNGRYPASDSPFQVDHPLGACMLIRRAAWEEVGPLDEGYFMYVEEVDWCRRARNAGWEVWHEPRAVAVHHSGRSARQRAGTMFGQLWLSRLRYLERYEGRGRGRLFRWLVRLGMRAEERRGRHSGERADAAARVRRLAS